ncbi:MAG: YMGG-like glycine zipper-containing protein [Pirellula sp.]
MRFATKLAVTSLIVGSLASNSYAQNQTRDGALLGGVTGALIGGVIGHQNKETTEGALIGGAVGAIAGGVVGNQRQQAERQRYYDHHYQQPVYHEHRTYVTTTAPQPRVVTRRPVSTSEVINMTRSGVSDTVIVAHIQSNGVAMRPDVNDVILMNQEGVSDYVITALQNGGHVRATTTYQHPTAVYRTYPQPAPVVIHEQVHVHPQPVYHSRPVYYVERRGF